MPAQTHAQAQDPAAQPLPEPVTDLDERYSSPSATATPWSEAAAVLEKAEIFWLSTVRPDGRPHVTPLIAVWLDGALYFATGERERKALNIATNPHVVLTTGSSLFGTGHDLVVEGEAVRITDEKRLRRLAEAWEAKYGSEWHFDVQDEAFRSDGHGRALVFEVAPATAFGFGRGEAFSQTRWRFTGRE
ncbi:pyridoxamine 5'-phosphate oxidase family protein [Streptomyces sp. NPDC057445]|uniref:pyridoxamine 5'-phosphate oxidase family protein n=1 Tax=Streptomyces sp. NPDC057445 TaxID=3346136 RepID=UPI003697AA77